MLIKGEDGSGVLPQAACSVPLQTHLHPGPCGIFLCALTLVTAEEVNI